MSANIKVEKFLARVFGWVFTAFTLILVVGSGNVQAEASVVRISYQFGLGFLPVIVALDQKLVENQVAALGLGSVEVTGQQISGAATSNDALLSGNIDVAAGGIGGLLQLWDKTRGDVKGLVSLNDMNLLLNTNDPTIQSIKDYLNGTQHKIALPAVKVGAHAIVLAMAAKKQFGEGKQYALDHLTVSLPHPEGYVALTGGHSEIRSHLTSLPFSYLELRSKNVHTVLSSYDVLGGPHNNTLLYTTRKWAEANPKLMQAVFNAFVEAEAWISAHPHEAAKLFKETAKSTLEIQDIVAMIDDPKISAYGPEPRLTMKFADFLHEIGRIKSRPTSWKDYFWDPSHGLKGS